MTELLRYWATVDHPEKGGAYAIVFGSVIEDIGVAAREELARVSDGMDWATFDMVQIEMVDGWGFIGENDARGLIGEPEVVGFLSHAAGKKADNLGSVLGIGGVNYVVTAHIRAKTFTMHKMKTYAKAA